MTTQCPKCKAENPYESKFYNECGTQITVVEKVLVITQTIEAPKKELTIGSTAAGGYP
jgi:hypothetical protein